MYDIVCRLCRNKICSDLCLALQPGQSNKNYNVINYCKPLVLIIPHKIVQQTSKENVSLLIYYSK